MKYIIIIFLSFPLFSISQENKNFNVDSLFKLIHGPGNEIIYEKVVKLDSVNNKDKIFNAAKSSLIKNTNYKYNRIDEDRIAGTINSEIVYTLYAKPFIGANIFNCNSRISIEVKENRFRIRLYKNTAATTFLNSPLYYTMESALNNEWNLLDKGRFKIAKSIIIPWDALLLSILNSFAILIKEGLKEDDF